jgi:WD40 repeat protein
MTDNQLRDFVLARVANHVAPGATWPFLKPAPGLAASGSRRTTPLWLWSPSKKTGYFTACGRRIASEVWKTSNGKLLHELSPDETERCNGVTEVLWSPDSRYVLGAVCPDDDYSSWEIAVWNARTGRHRGTLFSGGQVIEGVALLPNGQLLAASRDSIIRMWDSKQALQNIQIFEKSLK